MSEEQDTSGEQKIDKSQEKEKEDGFWNHRGSVYAWAVVVLFLIVRTTMVWQRKSINYVYGFAGEGLKAGNPAFEITTNYPQMEIYYGILSGLAYTLPMSLFGLTLGYFSNFMSQKTILASAITLAGLTQIATGMFDSFAIFFAMRVAHAAFYSVTDPLFFSMIGQYFPKNKRGTANSIIGSANFIGISLSSLSILLIN